MRPDYKLGFQNAAQHRGSLVGQMIYADITDGGRDFQSVYPALDPTKAFKVVSEDIERTSGGRIIRILTFVDVYGREDVGTAERFLSYSANRELIRH